MNYCKVQERGTRTVVTLHFISYYLTPKKCIITLKGAIIILKQRRNTLPKQTPQCWGGARGITHYEPHLCFSGLNLGIQPLFFFCTNYECYSVGGPVNFFAGRGGGFQLRHCILPMITGEEQGLKSSIQNNSIYFPGTPDYSDVCLFIISFEFFVGGPNKFSSE